MAPDRIEDEHGYVFFIGQEVDTIWQGGKATGFIKKIDHLLRKVCVRYPPPYNKEKFDLWFRLASGLILPRGCFENSLKRRVLRSGKSAVVPRDEMVNLGTASKTTFPRTNTKESLNEESIKSMDAVDIDDKLSMNGSDRVKKKKNPSPASVRRAAVAAAVAAVPLDLRRTYPKRRRQTVLNLDQGLAMPSRQYNENFFRRYVNSSTSRSPRKNNSKSSASSPKSSIEEDSRSRSKKNTDLKGQSMSKTSKVDQMLVQKKDHMLPFFIDQCEMMQAIRKGTH